MKKKFAFSFVLIFVFFSMVFAQDLPKIAVYVTGDIPDNNKRVFGPELLASLVNSGRYSGIERPNVFFTEAERKRTTEFGGAINDSQLSELGKEFGVSYICVADILPAFGIFRIEVRIVDVETVQTIFTGESSGSLKTSGELKEVLEAIVGNMFVEQAASVPEPKSQSEHESESESVPVAYAPEQPDRVVDRAPAVAVAPTPVPSSAPVAAAPAPAVAVESKWPPKAAVCVTGLNAALSSALSRSVITSLMKAKIYEGIESIDKRITGSPTDRQIIEAGKETGVDFVFVINVSGKINVRILDVDLATELANISLDGKLNTPLDAGKVAASIVNFILKEGPKPPVGYVASAPVAAAGRTSAGSAESSSGETEERLRKHSLGMALSTSEFEFHFRQGLGEHSRLYYGVGFNMLDVSETHFGSFMEWHSNGTLSFYGGPGVMLGFYKYDGFGSGSGLVFGVQGGVELRLGLFLIGAETRLGYYWRKWDNGGHAAIGIRTGIAF